MGRSATSHESNGSLFLEESARWHEEIEHQRRMLFLFCSRSKDSDAAIAEFKNGFAESVFHQ